MNYCWFKLGGNAYGLGDYETRVNTINLKVVQIIFICCANGLPLVYQIVNYHAKTALNFSVRKEFKLLFFKEFFDNFLK